MSDSLPLLAGSGGAFTVPLQTVLLLSAITLLPGLALLMTGFTRIIIVLSLLRQALGTPNIPPNTVLMGLSLFLTLFVMAPTLDEVMDKAYKPLAAQAISVEEAMQRAQAPMRQFMAKQTRQADLALFARLAKLPEDAQPQTVPFQVLVSAFVTSELKSAFQIGFLIFVPFLVIDMVVASVLASLGLTGMSPTTVALPFKLLLFVLADGWNLLLGSLAASFVR